jgi:hypothetical protein
MISHLAQQFRVVSDEAENLVASIAKPSAEEQALMAMIVDDAAVVFVTKFAEGGARSSSDNFLCEHPFGFELQDASSIPSGIALSPSFGLSGISGANPVEMTLSESLLDNLELFGVTGASSPSLGVDLVRIVLPPSFDAGVVRSWIVHGQYPDIDVGDE